MLHYLLSRDGLAELLKRLGYESDDGLIERCVEYYEPRTAHGSTLSRVVHAQWHARGDSARSWRLLVEAAHSDLDGPQGDTTREGIHLGAMAGTLDIVQRAYTGLETQGDVLRLDPAIPEALGTLAFTVRYRGHLVHLEFTTTVVRVRVDVDEGEPITVVVRAERYELVPGELLEVDVASAPELSGGAALGGDVVTRRRGDAPQRSSSGLRRAGRAIAGWRRRS